MAGRVLASYITSRRKKVLEAFGVNFTNILRNQIPKAQKDSQLKQLFSLLGSARVKAACEHVDEIDPWTKMTKTPK